MMQPDRSPSYYITSITGQLIKQGIIVDKTMQLPTLEPGFYNFAIDNKGTITSQTIVIY